MLDQTGEQQDVFRFPRVPEKCHQSKEFGGGGRWSRASHLTAFDLQLGPDPALLETAKGPGHRPRAA